MQRTLPETEIAERFAWGSLAVVIVLVGACMMIRAAANRDRMPKTAAAVVAPPRAREVQAVTVTQLRAAYDANELAADDRFKGQRLVVTGTVATIDETFFGSPELQLATPDGLDMAIALLDRDQHDAAARLEKGQRVELTCTGHGKHLGFVSLGDCQIRH